MSPVGNCALRTDRVSSRTSRILSRAIGLESLEKRVLFALPGSPFETNDGNLIVNGGAGAQDWANAPSLAIAIDKPTGQSDDSLGQGTKESDSVPSVVNGSIPNNKSDLTRFYVAHEKVNGKDFVYFAWERANTL